MRRAAIVVLRETPDGEVTLDQVIREGLGQPVVQARQDDAEGTMYTTVDIRQFFLSVTDQQEVKTTPRLVTRRRF